jgi:solute carrier family 25 (mitochondrial iron transporter), member 28/37
MIINLSFFPSMPNAVPFVDITEEEPYESLPPSTSRWAHLLAGGLAGISEHCIMYPLDSIKTRMQIVYPSPLAIYTSPWHAFKSISMSEGLLRLWKGMSSVALGAGPAHAIYFLTYEEAKRLLIRPDQVGHAPLSTGITISCLTILFYLFTS